MHYSHTLYFTLLLSLTFSYISLHCMTTHVNIAALKRAIEKRNFEQVEQALSISNDTANMRDSSLLHDALLTRSKKMVKLLLDHGVLINTFHPLLALIDNNSALDVIGIAELTYTGPGNAFTVALFLTDLSLIRLLLRYGATTNQEEHTLKYRESKFIKKLAKSLGAEGIFFVALIDDDPTLLQALPTQATTDVSAQTQTHSKLKRIKKLFKKPKKPFDLNTPNYYSKTPLMLAAVAGKEHVVRFLLQKHVNAELKDEQGHTAYTLARQQGNIQIAQLIENYVLSYKQSALAKYIMENNNVGITQDIAELIAYYTVTLD